MRPQFFTNQYGMIADYLAEYLREMRKHSFADAIDKWFCCNNLNQRDTIAVRRTTSGLLKLISPHGEYSKDIVRQCLEYALEARRRVKEQQLKKIGGMEFYDVHFSYIDVEDGVERFVTVPEQSGGALVPEGRLQPGTPYTISMGAAEMPGIYLLGDPIHPWQWQSQCIWSGST